MEKIKIERLLREYKTKKSVVESTKARIEAWKYAINHPSIILENYYSMNNREPGMPGSPTRNTSSPVEKVLTEKELTTETLKDWISEEESRIFHANIEVQQIQFALDALTKQERYIIECKYLENMNWHDIELSFNNQFRQQNYITDEGIRKINNKALGKIQVVLNPFYMFIA